MNGNESVCLPSNLDSYFWILASGQQTFGVGETGVSRVSATAGGIQMIPWWGAGFLRWIWTFGPPRAMWLPFPQFLPGTHVRFACILFGGGGEMEFLWRKSYGSFDHSLFSQHTLTMTQTQNISFTSFPGCLNWSLFLCTHFNRRPQSTAGDTGRGGEPDTRLHENSPAKEKWLHLTSVKRCMF